MTRFRLGSGGGEPPEVGHDVAVGLEDLPVGGVVSAYDGGVVLGLQPCPALVGGDALDIAAELGKRLEAAVGCEEFGRHLLLEGMHLEGRKDLVGVAERGEERLVVGRHGLGLEQAVDSSLIDMREDFAPDALLYGRHGIEAAMHLAKEGIDDGEGHAHLSGEPRGVRFAAGAGCTVVEAVNQKSVSAPVVGAREKKRLKRFFSVF